MELAFEQKQQSCLRRTAHLSLAQEQTQELIIPDSMPDASRTLICCAEPEVQSKTNREGSLLVTGTLRTGCLYADEAGGLQLLTSELPFTVKLECAELREDTQTLVRCCVRSADSRLINSRKVLLRVSILVQADGFEPQTESTRVLTDPPACLQLKTQTYEMNAPVELAERAFQVSEELNLPDGRPQIARLVSYSLTPVVQEQGLVGSKAVLKGTANLQITYLDNENALRTLSFSVPFSQYCQMGGDYDQDETLESVLLVTGVQLEPVASEQSQKLLFGTGILAQCVVLQPQQLTVCEDAYATKGDFHPEWQEQERLLAELDEWGHNSQRGYMDRARDYIAAHFSDSGLSLNEVSGHVGLSVSYLSSLFSKYQPPGFSHYLRQYRVEQARLLLESTDASVTEIGYQTGFNSSNSFIRTFKSLVGETPGRYRERCQGGKYENGKDDDT